MTLASQDTSFRTSLGLSVPSGLCVYDTRPQVSGHEMTAILFLSVWGPHSLLHIWYRVSLPGLKQPLRTVNPHLAPLGLHGLLQRERYIYSGQHSRFQGALCVPVD